MFKNQSRPLSSLLPLFVASLHFVEYCHPERSASYQICDRPRGCPLPSTQVLDDMACTCILDGESAFRCQVLRLVACCRAGDIRCFNPTTGELAAWTDEMQIPTLDPTRAGGYDAKLAD